MVATLLAASPVLLRQGPRIIRRRLLGEFVHCLSLARYPSRARHDLLRQDHENAAIPETTRNFEGVSHHDPCQTRRMDHTPTLNRRTWSAALLLSLATLLTLAACDSATPTKPADRPTVDDYAGNTAGTLGPDTDATLRINQSGDFSFLVATRATPPRAPSDAGGWLILDGTSAIAGNSANLTITAGQRAGTDATLDQAALAAYNTCDLSGVIGAKFQLEVMTAFADCLLEHGDVDSIYEPIDAATLKDDALIGTWTSRHSDYTAQWTFTDATSLTVQEYYECSDEDCQHSVLFNITYSDLTISRIRIREWTIVQGTARYCSVATPTDCDERPVTDDDNSGTALPVTFAFSSDQRNFTLRYRHWAADGYAYFQRAP